MTQFLDVASRLHHWLRASNIPDIDGAVVQITFPDHMAAWAAKAAICTELAPLTRDLREESSIRAALDLPFKLHGLTFRFVVDDKVANTLLEPGAGRARR